MIFDCDGTLAFTANLHFDTFNAALARQGAYMDRAWYDARTGLDRNDLVAEFAAQHDADLDCSRLVADSRTITVERAERNAVENPPVASLARRLKGKMRKTDVVWAILRGAGLDTLLVLSEETGLRRGRGLRSVLA